MIDTFNAVKKSVAESDKWQGFSVNLSKYGAGEVTIIDPSAANAFGSKIKFWIGGLMYFLTILFVIRRISNILGTGR